MKELLSDLIFNFAKRNSLMQTKAKKIMKFNQRIFNNKNLFHFLWSLVQIKIQNQKKKIKYTVRQKIAIKTSDDYSGSF
ncbi:hypothetical protein BpHYR1_006423 [Brachionus plicatilis]|uniref:Uncharacterized protein n=1 Tax=Brachionus plicatilis TaxID=10195 RepID=A0A3M7RMV0_BRAPC|nr:hypothetical protein BpHYR1_006423 [Brachionus plicatilis]